MTGVSSLAFIDIIDPDLDILHFLCIVPSFADDSATIHEECRIRYVGFSVSYECIADVDSRFSCSKYQRQCRFDRTLSGSRRTAIFIDITKSIYLSNVTRNCISFVGQNSLNSNIDKSFVGKKGNFLVTKPNYI